MLRATVTSPLLVSSTSRRLAWLNPAYLPLVATFFVIVALATYGGSAYDGYLNWKAVANLFNNSAFLGVVAIGMTFVILAGGIDLSVGSAIAFSSVLMAVLIHPSVAQHQAEFLAANSGATFDPASVIHGGGMHPVSAALVTLLVGTLFGLSMGVLIAVYELPPFMVTLAGMFLARAMGYVVLDFCSPPESGAASLSITHDFFSKTVSGWAVQIAEMPGRVNRRTGLPGDPIPVRVNATAILMVASYLVAVVVLHFTSFGRSVYAVGGDENSAKLLGVRVPRVKIAVYAISGFMAALAGVIVSADSGAGDPAGKGGAELDAIAAVVIGGTLLTGGRGFVIGTLMGVLVFGLIQAFTSVSKRLNAETTKIFIGTLMLIFILLQGGFNALGKWLTGSKR